MATKYERIYNQLKIDIDEIKQTYSYGNDSMAFGHLMLKILLDISDEEANESITDGHNDQGIDAIYIDTRTDKTHVHFFQFKFPESINSINKAVTQDELLKLTNGYEHFISNDEKFNQLTWNQLLIDKREEFIQYNDTDENTLHIVRYTTCEMNQNLNILDSNVETLKNRMGNTIHKNYVFAKEISEAYEKASANIWPDFNLSYKKDLSYFEDDFAKVSAYYISLYSLYEGIKDLSSNVFEGNVRYFDEKSRVNQGIITTLENECSRFHLLNNGITIVCSKAVNKSATDTVVITRGSIINGAQTVGCIMKTINDYLANNKSIDKFKQAFVNVKIIEIENKKELLDELVYTLNTQNQMKSSYLISNDSQIKSIQKEINNNTQYFLQIKNKEYAYAKSINPSFDKKVKDIIEIENGIQAFVSYENINDLAYLSKNSKAALFNETNSQLIIDELTADKLLNSYKLYVKIMDITRSYRAYRKDNSKSEIISLLGLRNEKEIENYKFINTGNYLILFVLGLYCRKNNEKPEDTIIEVIKYIAPYFKKKSNISNITKSKETFDHFKEKLTK